MIKIEKLTQTTPPESESALPNLRRQVDEIDAKIVSLLNERAKVALSIGAMKRTEAVNVGEDKKVHVYVPGREKKVFEKVAQLNEGPLSNESIQAIYREIMSASIKLQMAVSVGYLGPPGTFTHQAAMKRFGDSIEYVPLSSIHDVFENVASGNVNYGIVPFENSNNGPVSETLDQMSLTARSSGIKIRAETSLPIQHFLLTRKEHKSLNEIKRIYSHEQAFGQCRKWLYNNMKGVEQVCVKSTAMAAAMAAQEPDSAAIASSFVVLGSGDISCSNLKILTGPIQDNESHCFTRFLILANECDNSTGDDKTLILMTLDDRKIGSLCNALSIFKEENVNINMITTRPSGQKPWHYYFFLELKGHFQDEALKKAIERLENYTLEVQVMGSYPNTGEIMKTQ